MFKAVYKVYSKEVRCVVCIKPSEYTCTTNGLFSQNISYCEDCLKKELGCEEKCETKVKRGKKK